MLWGVSTTKSEPDSNKDKKKLDERCINYIWFWMKGIKGAKHTGPSFFLEQHIWVVFQNFFSILQKPHFNLGAVY